MRVSVINLLVPTSRQHLCLWSPSFIRVGVLFLGGQLRGLSDCYVSPLRSNWNSVLLLICCYYFPCLTAFPLFLHFLTSLISNCLSLLFGTQERPRRLPFLYKQERGDTEVLLCLGTCHRAFLCKFLLVTRSGHHHEGFQRFSRYEEIQEFGS